MHHENRHGGRGKKTEVEISEVTRMISTISSPPCTYLDNAHQGIIKSLHVRNCKIRSGGRID